MTREEGAGPEPAEPEPTECEQAEPPWDRSSTGSVCDRPDSPAGGTPGRSSDDAAAGPGAPGTGGEEEQPAPLVIRRRGRRVSTEPSPGYTGEPPAERQGRAGENDEQLRRDVPPHWG